ncbi:hypothetical protein BC940DRAFT_310556 [Gongronella butleri]|nr:hypothetical protein BC940DRAFT_310556 [Gongronella butleri]
MACTHTFKPDATFSSSRSMLSPNVSSSAAMARPIKQSRHASKAHQSQHFQHPTHRPLSTSKLAATSKGVGPHDHANHAGHTVRWTPPPLYSATLSPDSSAAPLASHPHHHHAPIHHHAHSFDGTATKSMSTNLRPRRGSICNRALSSQQQQQQEQQEQEQQQQQRLRQRRSSMAELTRHPAWLEHAGFMRRSKCSACNPDPAPVKSVLSPPDSIAVPIFGGSNSAKPKKKASWPNHQHHAASVTTTSTKRRCGGSAPTLYLPSSSPPRPDHHHHHHHHHPHHSHHQHHPLDQKHHAHLQIRHHPRTRSRSQPTLPAPPPPTTIKKTKNREKATSPPPLSLSRAKKSEASTIMSLLAHDHPFDASMALSDASSSSTSSSSSSSSSPAPTSPPIQDAVALAAANALVSAYVTKQMQLTPAQRLMLLNKLSRPDALNAMAAHIRNTSFSRPSTSLAAARSNGQDDAFNQAWFLTHYDPSALMLPAVVHDTPILHTDTDNNLNPRKSAIGHLYDTLTDASSTSDDSTSSTSSTLQPASSSSPFDWATQWFKSSSSSPKDTNGPMDDADASISPPPLSPSSNAAPGKRPLFVFQGMVHLGKARRQYALTLSPDAPHSFYILPRDNWVPDHQVPRCQVNACTAPAFGWLNRRHHCRRCGQVVCQDHSMNKLPLFHQTDTTKHEMARVCDLCCHQLLNEMQ